MSRPKVSVIVAVYNVEDYFERCLHSLFRQTLDNIEYIFVDDASPDSSIRILERILEQYPHRKSQIKIIKHKENHGVAAARKSGCLAATGEYLIHCDPDDYVELEMYEQLYNEAVKNDSDIVVCDYWQERDDFRIVRSIKYENTGKEVLEVMNKGYHFAGGPLWNFLTRRSLIMKYQIFPVPYADYAEDSVCRLKTLYYSDRIVHINKPFYHYCIRNDSITGTCCLTKQQFHSYNQNIQELIKFFKDKGNFQNLQNLLLLRLKFLARNLFRGHSEKNWFNLYKEAHRAIFYYREMPIIQRIFWALSFSNYNLYRIGCKSYKFFKRKDL